MSRIAAPPAHLVATLGRTGRRVHRLGVASSFGVGGRDLEAAVEEHGVNYLYWGSIRRPGFGAAIRALCARGLREELFLVVQSYARLACWVGPSLKLALRRLRLERADLLLLGWWNRPVSPGILAAARRLQEQGLVRHLGISTHERSLVPGCAGASPFDVVHLRYNAANRGAEREVFPLLPPAPRAGLVAFTATRWGQLLEPTPGAPPGLRVPSAGDCYRFALARPELDVCLSGPRQGEDLRAALRAVEAAPMSEEELAWMRQVGDLVYAGSSLRARVGERV